MDKICPNCGQPLPEEADFCLICFSRTNACSDTDNTVCSDKIKVPSVEKIKFLKSKKFKKVCTVVFTVALTVFIITCVPLPSLSKSNNINSAPVYVPVTNSNGETVTDEHGETVYETKPAEEPTKAKTLFQSIFDKDADEDSSSNNGKFSDSEENFLESIFNKGSETTAPQTEKSSNTEQNTVPQTSGTVPENTDENHNEPSTFSNNNQTESTVSSVGEFKYDIYKDLVRIVSYTGNAEIVTVPSQLGGINVGYIGANAFSNNSNIKIIKFQGSESRLTLNEANFFGISKPIIFFNNLPNLTQIIFPKNTYIKLDYRINNFSNMFKDCPKLASITFNSGSGSSELSSEDGVVYYKSGSNKILIYYPCTKTDSSFTVPKDVNRFLRNSMNNNPYIKSLNLNNSVTKAELTPNFQGCTNLESFYIPPGNPEIYTVDGIIYQKDMSKLASSDFEDVVYTDIVYPPAKKDTHYNFPADLNIYFKNESFCGNPYLKSFRAPDKSRFDIKSTMVEKVYLYDSEDQRTMLQHNYALRQIQIEFYK